MTAPDVLGHTMRGWEALHCDIFNWNTDYLTGVVFDDCGWGGLEGCAHIGK